MEEKLSKSKRRRSTGSKTLYGALGSRSNPIDVGDGQEARGGVSRQEVRASEAYHRKYVKLSGDPAHMLYYHTDAAGNYMLTCDPPSSFTRAKLAAARAANLAWVPILHYRGTYVSSYMSA